MSKIKITGFTMSGQDLINIDKINSKTIANCIDIEVGNLDIKLKKDKEVKQK